MREILRAAVTRKPIVALLELDKSKGGMSRSEIRAKLLEADAPCERFFSQYDNKYAMWGLDAEVQRYRPRCLNAGQVM
jgi:hypothetical protein